MSSGSVHAREGVTTLLERARLAGEKYSRLQAVRTRIASELEEKRQEVDSLSREVVLLTQVESLFKLLQDQIVVRQVRSIEPVITEGLQTIFHDQDLHFEAKVSIKYGKISIDFLIRQGKDDVLSIKGDPLESFGGGPASVASLLLRVITLLKLKKTPLLVLDETLAAVSDSYIEATGNFLRDLSKRMGIPMLVVTHKDAYLDHAHHAYQGHEITKSDGSWSLGLKRTK